LNHAFLVTISKSVRTLPSGPLMSIP
jgi:hypothetical protein